MCANLKNLATTIDKKLDGCRLSQLFNYIGSYGGSDWKEYVEENINNYNKIKIPTPPIRNNFDMYIITWCPGQSSPVHDHASHGCLLKVLQGTIVEQIYNKDLELHTTTFMSKDDVGYMDNSIGYHKIINYQNTVAVTLHIYSPSNYIAKTYEF